MVSFLIRIRPFLPCHVKDSALCSEFAFKSTQPSQTCGIHTEHSRLDSSSPSFAAQIFSPETLFDTVNVCNMETQWLGLPLLSHSLADIWNLYQTQCSWLRIGWLVPTRNSICNCARLKHGNPVIRLFVAVILPYRICRLFSQETLFEFVNVWNMEIRSIGFPSLSFFPVKFSEGSHKKALCTLRLEALFSLPKLHMVLTQTNSSSHQFPHYLYRLNLEFTNLRLEE